MKYVVDICCIVIQLWFWPLFPTFDKKFILWPKFDLAIKIMLSSLWFKLWNKTYMRPNFNLGIKNVRAFQLKITCQIYFGSWLCYVSLPHWPINSTNRIIPNLWNRRNCHRSTQILPVWENEQHTITHSYKLWFWWNELCWNHGDELYPFILVWIISKHFQFLAKYWAPDHMVKPTNLFWKAWKHVLRYLVGTT